MRKNGKWDHRLVALILLFGLLGTPRARAGFEVTDLGNLGGNYAFTAGINGLNQVVGYSTLSPDDLSTSHAFISDATTQGLHDLGTFPGGNQSTATGVNDNGLVVGHASTNRFGNDQAFQGQTSINPINLDAPYRANTANAVNNSGVVVGSADLLDVNNPGVSAGFVLNGAMQTILPTLGGSSGTAWGINDNGQVVGVAALLGDSTFHAFSTNGSDLTQLNDLGTLGGQNSYARGVNDNGDIIGESQLATGSNLHAFLYHDGSMRNIGLDGNYASEAFGINLQGDVVGKTDFGGSEGITHGFFYHDGLLYDLNRLVDPTLGLVITSATGINDQGFISADARDFYGNAHALLLSPSFFPPLNPNLADDFEFVPLVDPVVPEPGSLVLLSVGVGVASFVGWRRTRRRATAA